LITYLAFRRWKNIISMFIIYASLPESISFGYYFFYCIEYIVIDCAIFIFAIYFKCIFINDFSLYGISNRVEASVFCICTFFIIFYIALSILLLIVQFLFLPFTLSAFLLMIFLCMENRTEWKHRYFVFVRFLLNRYEGKSAIRGVRPIVVPAQSSLMQVFALF